jgi:formiminoglutamase
MNTFETYTSLESKKTDTTVKSSLLRSEPEEAEIVLLGYPDDLGIEKNGGRVGAKEGPNRIRKHLYTMTPQNPAEFYTLFDCGNLICDNDSSLEERHLQASKEVTKHLNNNKKIISLGGGHDYGFADGLGFGESVYGADGVTVFNFDAHLDLRDLEKGVTSGTPFYRLLKKYGAKLDLFQVGIQEHCNSKKLFDLAHQNENIHVLEYSDLYPKGYFSEESFTKTKLVWPETRTPCYVSVDIDGFSSSIAPGCSQSWASGFDLSSFMFMFEMILYHFNVRMLGIYEVSPPLDNNDQTSRLAAQIAYRWLKK